MYTKELWKDKPALLALMREDNANAITNLAETELDAFGVVNTVIIEMSEEAGTTQATEITSDAVMDKIRLLGFGQLPIQELFNLVAFRLYIPTPHATMAVSCLFQVCNGRVRSATGNVVTIGGLHRRKCPGAKCFC